MLEAELIKSVGQIAGVGGIALGVMLFLFRDIIRKNLISKLTKTDSYKILRLIIILVWIVTIFGIYAWVWGSKDAKTQLITVQLTVLDHKGNLVSNANVFSPFGILKNESDHFVLMLDRPIDLFSVYASRGQTEKGETQIAFNQPGTYKVTINLTAPLVDDSSFTTRVYTISGQVFEEALNRPLSDVIVDIYSTERTLSSRTAYSDTTGSDGQFSIDCSRIKNSQYPLHLGIRHSYWEGVRFAEFIVDRPGVWKNIKIPATKEIIDIYLQSDNLLSNPGFETTYQGSSTPIAWEFKVYSGSSSFNLDNQTYKSGSYSAFIYAMSPDHAKWVQRVMVEPFTEYRLSGWVRTENIENTVETYNRGANLSIERVDESAPVIRGASSPLLGNNDWTFLTFTFTTSSSNSLFVIAQIGTYGGMTQGKAWFDDLTLERLNN